MRRITLLTGRLVAVVSTEGVPPTATLYADDGESYVLRGVPGFASGDRVRIVVERCPDAGRDVGEEQRDQEASR